MPHSGEPLIKSSELLTDRREEEGERACDYFNEEKVNDLVDRPPFNDKLFDLLIREKGRPKSFFFFGV